MLDATTRSGGTATAPPRAAAAEAAVPALSRAGAFLVRALLSPWSRFSLLVGLLASAATAVLLFEPQRLLTEGWPPHLGGAAAALVFAVAYGLCTVAFVPRPLLNLAAGGAVRLAGGARMGAGRDGAGGRGWRSGWGGCSDRTHCVRCCGGAG
ncbi:hypothetical protein GCM10020256_66670 [Streptomyces thermocoprophilus]